MATRDTPFAPGTPCWVDLLSTDPDRARAFYAGLFGWTTTEPNAEFGGYSMFLSDGRQVGGLMLNDGSNGSPDVWSTYISTADIDATVASAAATGGQVVAPVMAVGDLGSMAILTDPAGGMFGVWQAGKHTGFTKYNEPGSVTWDEYHSKNFAATTDFYGNLFGWHLHKMSDTDEFRYFLGQVNGETVAGLMDSAGFLPAQVPSHWAVYFNVENVDDAVVLVEKLGGTITRAAEDTPFGRMADATDPTGAMFKLHQAPPEA
jgi:predicted enzyme related to lactoylglutathione lyase